MVRIIGDIGGEDRRRARSRAALLSAAEGLFAQRGVEGVTIDEIVAAADVAKGTFYNHFPDKDAIARAIAAAVRSEVEADITALNKGVTDPALRTARALCVYVRFAAREPKRARALTRIFAGAINPGATLNRGVTSDIKRGIAEGRFTARNLDMAILFVMGTVIAASAAAVEGAPARETAEALAEYQLHGLRLKGREAAAIAAAAADAVFNPEATK